MATKVNDREDRARAIGGLLHHAAEDGQFQTTFRLADYLLSDFAEVAKIDGITVEHDLLNIVVRWDNHDGQ